MNFIAPGELSTPQLNEVAALACDLHRQLYDPTAPEWAATPYPSQDKFRFAVSVFAKSGGPLTKQTLPIENAAQLALLQWQLESGILTKEQVNSKQAAITLGFDKKTNVSGAPSQVAAPTDPPTPPSGEGDAETPPPA